MAAPGKETKKIDRKAAPTSGKQPDAVQLGLIGLVLLGLGAIAGYVIFYSIYNHRCSDMMDHAERRFNETKQELQNKLIEAIHNGDGNDNRESELLELRGRLESQTELMNKHQNLLDKHQMTVDELAMAKATQDKTLLQKSRLENELEASKKKATDLQTKLSISQGETKELSVQLGKATFEVEEIKRQIEATVGDPNCEAAQAASTSHLQALHKALCTQRHGAGPYFAEFTVAVDGQADKPSFTIKIASLDTLPNSVFAFLTLVDNEIYTGAEFFLTQSVIHLNSNEEALTNIGYGATALAVVEGTTVAPCRPYSIGFVGNTGGLKIIMTSDTSKHGSLACFGHIIHGRQTMSQIQRATREGKGVSIESVKYVPFEGKPAVGEGEL